MSPQDFVALISVWVSFATLFVTLWILALIARGANPLRIDLEMNPFSLASRAARAERAGQIGRAVRLYVAAGKQGRALRCLSEGLPDWPIRGSLVLAVRVLLQVQESIPAVREAGLAESLSAGLLTAASDSLEMVCRKASQVRAAYLLGDGLPPEGLERDVELLNRSVEAVLEARQEAAKLAVLRASPQGIESRFRELADRASAVREVLSERQA